jgi:hypothetical protein
MSGIQTAAPPAAGPHSYAEVVAAPPPSSSSSRCESTVLSYFCLINISCPCASAERHLRWACRGVKGSRGQQGDKSGEPFLGFLKLQGLQHYLRLRKGLRVTLIRGRPLTGCICQPTSAEQRTSATRPLPCLPVFGVACGEMFLRAVFILAAAAGEARSEDRDAARDSAEPVHSQDVCRDSTEGILQSAHHCRGILQG